MWLRPASSAARVGEQIAVVWKRVYFNPAAASRSKFGVLHGPPKALEAPKPTSSINTISTFGTPAGGRSGPDRRELGVRVLGVVADQARILAVRNRQDLPLNVAFSDALHLHWPAIRPASPCTRHR
jgi:hypothetical protein